MKSIKIISLFFILLVAGVSCSDFLDKEPHSLTPETYFNNEQELQLFLTGVYSPIMQELFYGSYYPVDISGGDDLSFYQRANGPVSIICANANSSTPSITTFWRVLYEGINRANMLLENADKNPAIAETYRTKIKAEALFLRSFYYFNLVQGWGDVPLRLKSTQSVSNLDAPRIDKQVVYDQLIGDIISAIPNLGVSNASTGTVTQSAAKGLLARIYLFRAGECYRDDKTPGAEVQTYYAEAKRWALEVKESGLHSLATNYSQVFVDICSDKYNSTGKLESIWEAEEAGNSSLEKAAGRIGNVIGFGATSDYSTVATIKELKGMANPGYSYRFIYASSKLYEMYESEGDTARGDWNIANYEYVYATTGLKEVNGRKYYFGKQRGAIAPAGYTYSESPASNNKTLCAAKYRREYESFTPKNKNYTPINFPILRYSDILLMIAEADNELTATPSDLAYKCIDAVRVRAHISPLAGTALSKDSFREAIKKERAMEFCFEATRRWDLIRWGDFYKNMMGMQTYVNNPSWATGFKYAGNYYKVSKAYNYLPIPEAEMAINKAITKNNPGW
jgi:starch-binding outer membrane protein, SusD/RagB family